MYAYIHIYTERDNVYTYTHTLYIHAYMQLSHAPRYKHVTCSARKHVTPPPPPRPRFPLEKYKLYMVFMYSLHSLIFFI